MPLAVSQTAKSHTQLRAWITASSHAFDYTYIFSTVQVRVPSLFIVYISERLRTNHIGPRDALTYSNPMRLCPSPTARKQVPWQQNFWLPSLPNVHQDLCKQRLTPDLLVCVCVFLKKQCCFMWFQLSSIVFNCKIFSKLWNKIKTTKKGIRFCRPFALSINQSINQYITYINWDYSKSLCCF